MASRSHFRFIPAGAGNTFIQDIGRIGHDGSSPRARGTRSPNGLGARDRAVHPRGRGEHHRQRRVYGRACGSSPRARGTPQLVSLPDGFNRFIPAGAGNTSHRCDPGPTASVHPRGRGEHCAPNPPADVRGGSSPRARGTLSCGRGHRVYLRFIPAGAGNTRPGGNDKNDNRGSSPRARGTLRARFCGLRHRRFIPAGAGNTASCRSQAWA